MSEELDKYRGGCGCPLEHCNGNRGIYECQKYREEKLLSALKAERDRYREALEAAHNMLEVGDDRGEVGDFIFEALKDTSNE